MRCIATGLEASGGAAGGALGASLTRNLDYNDRGYAYNSYDNGFNSGRAGGLGLPGPLLPVAV